MLGPLPADRAWPWEPRVLAPDRKKTLSPRQLLAAGVHLPGTEGKAEARGTVTELPRESDAESLVQPEASIPQPR